MPIIETKGVVSSQGYGQFARSAAVSGTYIEDVFSTTLYTGTGAAQSIANGIALGTGATSAGWIGTLVGSGSDQGNAIAVDGSGNIYVCGTSNTAGTNDFLLVKYNASGVLQWQYRYDANSDAARSIAIDGSGNVYVCGSSNAAVTDDLILSKLDSAGTPQWTRRLTGSGSEDGYAVAVDGSGNAYVCGTAYGSYGALLLAKYNSSGALQWQRTLEDGSGSTDTSGAAIAVNSAGDAYVCGQSAKSGTANLLLAKYNTSGSLQWQRELGAGAAATDTGLSVAVGGSGDVYVSGYSNASGTIDGLIAKYNSSGVIQWQRRLVGTGGSGDDVFYSVAVDSSENVYVCGYSGNSGTSDLLVAKYSSAGAIQWQRSLGGAGSDLGFSVSADLSGNIYVCGRSDASGTTDVITAKLPGDGSGTGSYFVGGQTFVYSSTALTDTASTLSEQAATLNSFNSAYTDAAQAIVASVSTLTSIITPLAQGAGLGGLVWIKGNSTTSDHALYDTARGATFDLASNLTTAQTTQAQGLTAFLGSGFSIGSLAKLNTSAALYSAWTFAKQPKFFDVVTYTGNGANRTIAHNLGSVPGAIWVKRTDTTGDWQCYHRSLANTQYMVLNTTAAVATGATRWNSTTPTDSVFSLGTDATVNASGGTYVAYLFAHNAGGFGASGTDSVISCGSFTGNSQIINLGWEPQWIVVKSATASGSWNMVDITRGLPVSGTGRVYLSANDTSSEISGGIATVTSTGFEAGTGSGVTAIYIAIRRGPMRTPTLGTSVFMPTVYTGTNVNNRLVNTFIQPDMVWMRQRNDAVLTGMVVGDRLRGQPYLLTGSTAAEVTSATAFDQRIISATEYGSAFSSMNGVYVGTDATAKLNVNTTASNHIAEAFRRAPGFFDVVCYTGTGSVRTVNHNLGVVPELMVVRRRDGAAAWAVYSAPTGNTQFLSLNDASIPATESGYWNNTTPTSSVFTVSVNSNVNTNASTYVAYLFASCPGVSKVGTYTGTGSTVQVNCGFTAGARFVLIKRTDAVGSWYVWDSARGIVAANDPYLRLNSTAAEVTNTDWVDTLATGFEVSNAGSNLVNENGGTYLFLAIA